MRKLSLKELNRVDIPTFKKQDKTPFVLVMDNIRSALNVGSAFRTADAFALQHIHLCGITAKPPHREILKTAIGASEAVDWTYWPSTQEAIAQLKKENYLIIGIEQASQSTPLQSFAPDQPNPVALVFGNEVKGIDQPIMDLLDVCLEIPQFGTKHSLNISVCLGIVVWELFRKKYL